MLRIIRFDNYLKSNLIWVKLSDEHRRFWLFPKLNHAVTNGGFRHSFYSARCFKSDYTNTMTGCEKSSNPEFFLVRIFPHSDWIRRDTPCLSAFSPNAGKYGPKKTPYLVNFNALWILLILIKSLKNIY